jgi:exodeoxyribonuclease V beta subunit
VQQAVFPSSFWQITSYSALAYQKDTHSISDSKQDETLAEPDNLQRLMDIEADLYWKNNIRYSLRGGANTGDCLHNILEHVAKGEILEMAVSQELRAFGLTKQIGALADDAAETAQKEQQQAVVNWMHDILAAPLSSDVPSLGDLFSSAYVLPECGFDFAIGSQQSEVNISYLNEVLQLQCGASSGVARKDHKKQINGVMTGFIDLLFIHDKKIYVMDYKSNTLGKSPRFYDNAAMQLAMQDSRYDLQYLIYSVAAHRYMKQRLGSRYAFDGGEYSFGGIFYLFLRGMGLQEYPQHGIYFSRPTAQQIAQLDAAFVGEVLSHA